MYFFRYKKSKHKHKDGPFIHTAVIDSLSNCSFSKSYSSKKLKYEHKSKEKLINDKNKSSEIYLAEEVSRIFEESFIKQSKKHEVKTCEMQKSSKGVIISYLNNIIK